MRRRAAKSGRKWLIFGGCGDRYASCKTMTMGIAHEVSVAAGHAIHGLRAGAKKLAWHRLAEGMAPEIAVLSVAFDADTPLPISCTVDGVGAAPPLSFEGAPAATQSLVVICEDPDAPQLEPFVHWLVYGIPANAQSIDAQSQHEYRLGQNSRSEIGFTPAAPPPGHGPHHYHFQVFALDASLNEGQGQGGDREQLLDLMRGHVLAWGELVGTYERE